MTPERRTTSPRTTLLAALSSPMRLELVGLFTQSDDPVSISEMAERLGRPATSLYHHVRVLEDAGALRRAGTRPKGKRSETLYALVGNRLALAANRDDEAAARQAGRTMRAALRMAERDFVAALQRDDVRTEGAHRNLVGLRAHMRLSPNALARLNEFLDEMERLQGELIDDSAIPGPDDQFLSLTFAMAPLRGRRVGGDADRIDGEEQR